MVDYTPTLIPLPAAAVNPATTPLALKAQRDYANALLYGKGQQPVQHWSQGVSNMVSALMGGQLDYMAGQKERGAMGDVGRGMNIDIGGPTGSRNSFSDAPSDEGGTKTADAGDMGDMAARKAAIATIESGSPEGNYHAIGPVVQKGAYAGDRAYGKYQVMGKNLQAWSKEIFGQSMTPEQFMANPQAQEKMFEVKSTSNPRDWFGHGKSDGYTTGANYEKRYAEGLRKYGGGGAQSDQPAMSLSGEPAEAAGPAAITAAALRGGAPSAPRQQAMPVGGSAPLVDPDTVPRQPRMSKQEFQAIQSSPYASDAQKAAAFGIYMQQNQPTTVPVTGGSVVVSPYDPRVQRGVSDVHWGTKKLPGGLEYSVPSTVKSGPNGEVITTPATRASPVGPRSDAGGAVTPSVAPEGGLGPTPASVQATAQSVPLPTARPPDAPAPVQVASLDPTAGITAVPAEDAAPVVPVTGETKVAQAGPSTPLNQALGGSSKPPPGYDQDDWDAIRGYKKFENDAALLQEKGKADIGVTAEATKKSNELSVKRYEEMLGRVESATEQRKNVSTARAMMADKQFYAGLGAGLKENWKQLQVSLGIDPNASAPMEVFRKTTAQSIMSGLKTAFGGLGQIRVAEIELQKVANASTNNSPAAIRALLEVTDRNAALVQDLGEMTTAYKSGEAVMDPRDPTKMLLPANLGPDGEPMERNGVDAKFDRVAQRYAKEHPTFSKEEYDNFHEVFKAPGEKAGALPIELPETAVGQLKKGTPTTFKNGQVYTLGDDGKPQRLK